MNMLVLGPHKLVLWQAKELALSKQAQQWVSHMQEQTQNK